MGFLKRSWKWINATDTAISWADRVLRILGVSAGIGVVSGALTWVVQNFYAALVVGLVAWLAALMGLLANTARQAESRVAPLTGAQSPTENAVAQGPQFAVPNPLAQDKAPKRSYFKDEAVELSRLVRQMGDAEKGIAIIKGLTFEKCIIYGPAVLAPMNTAEFGNVNFVSTELWLNPGTAGNHKKAWMWRVPREDQSTRVGVIGVEDCIFRECTFILVGVLVGPDEYERLSWEIPGS